MNAIDSVTGMSSAGYTDAVRAMRQQTPNVDMSRTANMSDQALRELCGEFESLIVEQMMKAARKTLNPENNMMYGGQSEEIFTDLLDTEQAKTMSRVHGFGLADMMFKQLTADRNRP